MKILLLGAFEKEIAHTLVRFKEQTQVSQAVIKGYKCHTLSYNNHDITISLTGVGTAPAMLSTHVLGKKLAPDLIIMCGTAGALLGNDQNNAMKVGNILISEKVVYIDQYKLFQLLPNIPAFSQCAFDPHSNQRITHEYTTPQRLVTLSKSLPNLSINSGTFGVTNFFPAPKDLLSDIHALDCKVVEMESSGVFQSASKLNIPALTVRAISNLLTKEGEDLGESPENVQFCAENISKFILALLGSNQLTQVLNEIKRESIIDPSEREFVPLPFSGSLEVHKKKSEDKVPAAAPIAHKTVAPSDKLIERIAPK